MKGGKITLKKTKEQPVILRPADLKKKLDERIIGQEAAKKVLSVEVCNHLKRVSNPNAQFKKTNMMIVGPTGTGKTLMLETLASLVDVPLVISDATTFTEAGYVGKDVQSCLVQLLEKVNYNIAKAETGIVYIDEADKMVAKKGEGKNNRDIRGESVQQALLKIIEGADVEIEVPTAISPSGRVTINTNNILFVFGGAFEGIEKIAAQRQNKTQRKPLVEMHMTKTETAIESGYTIEPIDVIKYGFIREFMGRVPMVVTLHRLSVEQLLRVLAETEHSVIKEFESMFRADGINIKFDVEALLYIAEVACSHDTGARGIRGIMSKWLNPLLYDISQEDVSEFTITKDILKSYNGQC